MMFEQANHLHCDVLVVGGGLAGCWAALRACQQGSSVILVDKGYVSRAGCSPVCGGVMTAPLPSDDLDEWADEFIVRGAYTNNQEWLDQYLADQVVRLQELEQLGIPIVRDETGAIRRIKSRGMTNVRCLQFNPKETMIMLRQQIESLGCQILDRLHIKDLITAPDGQVVGAVGFGARSGEAFVFHAGATVVTSGPLNMKGRGVVDAVGADGHALAYRAGATLVDMEFVFGGTFTLMQKKYKLPAYNIALGHGSRLINAAGERFMERYDPDRLERGELPHVIAAFLNEMLCGRGPVYLDMRHCDEHFLADLLAVKGHGWADEMTTGRLKNFRTRPVLIEPTWSVWSHRCGIQTDLECATSVAGLYAAGSVVKNEVTGTHASAGIPTSFCNVSGARAGLAAAVFAKSAGRANIGSARDIADQFASLSDAAQRKVGETPNDVFISIREMLGTPLDTLILTAERLANFRETLAALRQRCENVVAPDAHEMVKLEEAINFIEVFDLCMMSAEGRTESRESFYRSDYPYTDNVDWFCWHTVRLDGTERRFGREPIPRENYRQQPPDMPNRILSPLAHNLRESNPIS